MFTVTFINPANFRREALYPRSLKFGSTHTQFFQREIIAKAFEVHKGIEEKVKSWMQTAKVPIDRILSDTSAKARRFESGPSVEWSQSRAKAKNIIVFPVPAFPVWLLLKTLERLGIPAGFRSDSLVSLLHQNQTPSFELTRKTGVRFREFSPKTLQS